MSDPIRIPCSNTIVDLQRALRNVESVLVEIKSIEKDGDSTVVTVDQVDDPPSPVFVVLDPAGTVTMPGKQLVCRGSACIGHQKQKVALFRVEADSNGDGE